MAVFRVGVGAVCVLSQTTDEDEGVASNEDVMDETSLWLRTVRSL